jgi:hypothetical protein
MIMLFAEYPLANYPYAIDHANVFKSKLELFTVIDSPIDNATGIS